MTYQRGLPFSAKLPKKLTRQQKENAVIKLTKQRPEEFVKADRNQHVLNPNECPDFMEWMVNG